MKDLPRVYANKIDKEIVNSQEVTTVLDEYVKDVDLNNILTKDKFSFNHIYLIKLKDTQIKDSIIQISNKRLLTIDNGWINIDDIISLKEIKK
ncbi:MAG: hypothetical protein IJ572_04380 [Bacilli bacterium]|nr:hypothetical protein [Bacilli bacterium]